MIYLIDDKKERQNKYGWTIDAIKKHHNSLLAIWTYDDMADEQIRQRIFSKDSVICLHESFFQNPINKNEKKDFTITREKLVKHAEENPSILLVFFSGSISSRVVNKNIIYIPVNRFYENLFIFLNEFNDGQNDFRYLLYGKNPKLEEKIRRQYVESTNGIDSKDFQIPIGKNFFLQQSTLDLKIVRPLLNCHEEFISNNITIDILNKKMNNWFNNNEYDNIFIPLCFGSTFSDFNGLWLATLIRCTKSKNQLSRIYIYCFLNSGDFLEYLIENEYLKILKTKNVKLIGYTKQEFFESANKDISKLDISELPIEMNKLKLQVPENYEDNHSIANEFGIYQLAYNAGIDINEITDFNSEKLNTTYFKWLIAKNGLYEDLPEHVQISNNEYKKKLKGLTVLGKIDLAKLTR